MSADWIEGRFEGIYSGPRRSPPKERSGRFQGPHADDASEIRRYDFEIQSGRLRDVGACDGPDLEAIADEGVIRQRRVKHVRLTGPDGSESEAETSLFDVQISDWDLKYPAEAGDRAYGTIVGTLRARRRPAAVAEPVEASMPLPEALANEPVDDPEVPSLAPSRVPDRSVEGERATGILESPGWVLVMLLVAAVFAGIVYGCGFRTGVVWLVPVELALGILWLTGGGLVGGTPRWLSGSLPLMQLFVLWTPLELAWQTGCWPVLGWLQWALVAMPMALAASLGVRKSLWLTGAIWTLVLCGSCARPDGVACVPALVDEAAGPSEARSAETRSSRTDSRGRWPVMPPAAGASAARGLRDLSGDASGRDGVDRTGPGSAGDSSHSWGAAAADRASVMAPDGMESSAQGLESVVRTISGRTGGGVVDGTVDPSTAQSPPASHPAASSTHPAAQIDGGWLSPEHRRAERLQTRISIEQANRTPALFFDNGGAHRVYVPTDPIFEDGSSRPRRDAPLVLARVAALLSLPTEDRVILEVHSDSAGSEEGQIELSRRRAEIVRSWLVDRGHVSPARFEMVPVGGGRPLVPPDGDYGAQQPNRRIEIRLVEEE